MRQIVLATLLICPSVVQAADMPAACPGQHVRIVRSVGGSADYLGNVSGIPELCHMRRPDGVGDFYFGAWRTDWPGAGDAYPALRSVVLGGTGTSASFVTHSAPGLQWIDTFTHGGFEAMVVENRIYQTLKLVHERNGIEGNTYHSIITSWRDVATGATLRVFEKQIAGQSYGPGASWTGVRVETLP